jgi:hypothetical protein
MFGFDLLWSSSTVLRLTVTFYSPHRYFDLTDNGQTKPMTHLYMYTCQSTTTDERQNSAHYSTSRFSIFAKQLVLSCQVFRGFCLYLFICALKIKRWTKCDICGRKLPPQSTSVCPETRTSSNPRMRGWGPGRALTETSTSLGKSFQMFNWS